MINLYSGTPPFHLKNMPHLCQALHQTLDLAMSDTEMSIFSGVTMTRGTLDTQCERYLEK